MNDLKKRGFIEIQQSGFSAHSLMHPQIVIMKKNIFAKPRQTQIQANEIQTEYHCPYCGEMIKLFEQMKKAWFLKQNLVRVVLKCVCGGTCTISIDDRRLFRTMQEIIGVRRRKMRA